jgi:hypothetical protein
MINRAKGFNAEINNRTRNGIVVVGPATEVIFDIHDLETTYLNHSHEHGLYDIVYNSLAFQYIEDIVRLFHKIHGCLRKGSIHGQKGKLIFSVEHPIVTAPVNPTPGYKVIREAGEDWK